MDEMANLRDDSICCGCSASNCVTGVSGSGFLGSLCGKDLMFVRNAWRTKQMSEVNATKSAKQGVIASSSIARDGFLALAGRGDLGKGEVGFLAGLVSGIGRSFIPGLAAPVGERGGRQMTGLTDWTCKPLTSKPEGFPATAAQRGRA